MLKNSDIIQKLNPESKVSLIADGNTLFTQGYARAGIPRVAVSSMDEVNANEGNLYPSLGALSNSWNTDLVSSVAQDIAARAKLGVNLLKTPPVRVKSNPYTEGISEDPYLVRTYAYGILKSVRDAGVMPCLSGIAMSDADFKYLDAKMDFRTVRDYFLSPYKALSSLGEGVAVTACFGKLEGSYVDVNRVVLSNMLTTIAEKRGGYVICEGTDGDDTVKYAVKYTLATGGNPAVLNQALINYNYIKESINTGDASGNDLDAACRDYSAVSPTTVDELCDKVISFALDCNKSGGNATPADGLYLTAAEESIVLLKNRDNLLPLKKKCKIAVVGEPAFNNYCGESFVDFFSANGGFEITGTARGYEYAEDRSENLLNEARVAAKGAETVIVFVGMKEEGGNRSKKLPANRIALVDAMTRLGKKVIVVVAGEGSVDMGFDTNAQSVLIAPLGSKGANEALTNILRGVANPSGKLAETYYSETDAYFDRIRTGLRSGKRRIGGFIGYRYYDTAREKVKYPFGFGLSYTTFSYSGLSVNSDSVDVTVKNTGKYDGSEVVQLYVGKNSSGVVRPVKELKGFTKVFLKAGESKTVRFRINTKLLAVYDVETGKNIVESGEYVLYAGSSVNDVRSTAKMSVNGDSLTDDGKKISDYIQAPSDILSEGYMLGNVKLTKGKGKALITLGVIAMIVALLGLGVMFALHYLAVITINDKLYLQIIFLALAGLFVVFMIIMFIGIGLHARAKKRAVTVNAMKKSAPKPAHPFETLFEKEFKVEEEEKTEVKQEVKEAFDEEQEALRHIDITLTLRTACSQLVSYCVARGVNIDSPSAARVLAALASSRLVVLRSRSSHLLPKFLRLLNGYFGTEEYVESFSGIASLEDFISKTSRAVGDAANVRKDVHIAGLTNVNSDNLRDILLPLMKYAVSPEIPCSVKYGYDNKLDITPNVWYVLALDGNARIAGEDIIVLNSSVVTDINISECPENDVKPEAKHLSYYQLLKFASNVAADFPMDEDKCWKRVDKLEKYVNARTPYHIGNKAWLRAERFASTVLACGGEQAEALDATVAGVLLPSVICLLNGKLSPEEDGLATVIENLFGEDGTEQCKVILNAYGLIN